MTRTVWRLLSVNRGSSNDVTFVWEQEPAGDLYCQTDFTLTFPESVDIGDVPNEVWWRIAMWCTFPHWVLLRPVHVELPFRLSSQEREFWLRLCDAIQWTLEAKVEGDDLSRAVEFVEIGASLPRGTRSRTIRETVSCFSGGRDSLTQFGLLRELGEPTVLATTRSPRPGSIEHTSTRFDYVLGEVQRRTSTALFLVESDFRSVVNNGFAGRYEMAVTELTDCLLYQAVAVVVAWVRGADHVTMASEYEVQATQRRGGVIAQHPHVMYSAATLRALSALVAPWGMAVSGLTAPLRQFQVQRLLASRFPDLSDLQYSCWELSEGQGACSACRECARVAWALLADGNDPALASIDLRTLLLTGPGWVPPVSIPGPGGDVSGESRRHRRRQLAAVAPDLVARCVNHDEAAMAAFDELRQQVLGDLAEPLGEEPGYCADYLELLDHRHRDALTEIFGQYFPRDQDADTAAARDRIMTVADWITAPLAEAEAMTPRPPDIRAVRSAFMAPATLDAAEFARVASLLPDPEPCLADSGTAPLRVADTDLSGAEAEYLAQCVADNYISSTGAFVGRFEEAFATFAGTNFAVSCSSGTTALQLAYAASGIDAGDEVIMPTFTMVATANSASHLGARPVFVDTDPDTWNLSVDAVRDAITSATRAIVLVHTYGRPVDPVPFRELAERNGLILIEDSAEAHGATAHGRAAGSLGDLAAFSFYGNKILTTGEGGMVTTDDPQTAAAARELRDHGFSAERHFWHRLRAYNFRMSNMQAAVGLAQVERVKDLLTARAELASMYDEALHDIPGVVLPPPMPPALQAVNWMYGIRITSRFPRTRDEVRRHLAAAGIETRTFFVPIHLQPAYLRDYRGSFPVAEQLSREGLYLPSGPSLTAADVERVASRLRH